MAGGVPLPRRRFVQLLGSAAASGLFGAVQSSGSRAPAQVEDLAE